MAKYKMYRRRCDISWYIKNVKNYHKKIDKIHQKSIDFERWLWYHNKCTEEHMKSKEYKLVKTKQKWIKNIKILVYYFALFRGKISNKKLLKSSKKVLTYVIKYSTIRFVPLKWNWDDKKHIEK